LGDLGCSSIFDFADGESAFNWLEQNGEPSLIIMEWRIPKITGPILLQRIRSKGFVNVPLIILSSLIKSADMPIIRELGVASLAVKPLDREAFLKVLVYTVQQDRLPSEMFSLENKIRTLLVLRNITEAESLLSRYLADSSIPSSRKTILEAELYFAKEQYLAARDLAVAAVKQSGESLFALNILGKCLMTMREYESALKCFKKAQSISPMNIERLVTMAEAQAELGDGDEAKKALNTAKDIDPQSKVVAEGAARVAIAAGASSEAQRALASLSSNINLVRYLNNKAVAHAKCGFADEGIEIYQKTLVAIPQHESDLVAVVRYNMALARIRRANFKEAISELDSLLATPNTRVHKKASSLKARLTEAVNQGVAFVLTESETATSAAPDRAQKGEPGDITPANASTLISAMLEVKPGEHCCYLLFKSTANESLELQKLLRAPLKFRPRKALERGETFKGAEGTKVAS